VLAIVHWARTGVFAPYRELMWRWFLDERRHH
jgi:hypothetical protein